MTIMSVLVKAFAGLATSIELADDEVFDSDVAASMMDDAAAVFEELSEPDRAQLAEMIRGLAASEPNLERRQVLLELPAGLGLVEDE